MSVLQEIPQTRIPATGTGRGILPFTCRAVPQALAAMDVASILALNIICGAAYGIATGGPAEEASRFVGLGIAMAAIFSLAAQGYGLYSRSHLRRRTQMRDIALIWSASCLLIAIVGVSLRIGEILPPGAVLLTFSAGLLGLLTLRLSAQRLLTYLTRSGALSRRQVAVVAQFGSPPLNSIAQTIEEDGGRVYETVLLPPGATPAALSEILHRLVEQVRKRSVDEILLATSWTDPGLIESITAHLRVVPVPVRLVPDPLIGSLLAHPFVEIGDTPAIELQRAPLTPFQRAAKRGVDVTVALLMMPILLPFLGVVAALIAIDSRGPVLFRQHRMGFNGLLFQIYKFRTMTTMDDGEVIQQAREGDARVTRVGRILRKLSIDELPQIFNVLKGDMSLVGPRPHALAHDNEYGRLITLYAARHNMKPGITGWAQVHGLRGPTPQVEQMMRRVDHDLWYVDHWSLWLDIKIIALTVVAVCSPKNAF